MTKEKEMSMQEIIDNAKPEDIQATLHKLAKIPSETERAYYIKKLSKKLGVSKKEIRDDLKKHINNELLKTPSKVAEEYSEEEKKKAEELLREPNLLERFLEMTEKVRIVKEEGNKLCLYLAYTSRKLKNPLSLLILGPSSAGKSYLSNTILENFIPKDEYFSYSRITPQSLYYMRDKSLSHKTLIVFEQSGSAKADYSIRTFISEKGLKIGCPMKDPKTGEYVTKDIIIKGPIQFVSTTTKTKIHPENKTRIFTLYVDDSPEKVQASLETIADSYVNNQDEEELNSELRIWRCAQTLLVCQKVRIPFATFLVNFFSSDNLRTQRDFQNFLSLIEASALLHQYQREKEEDSIIANVEDYEVARQIGEVIINRTLKGISSKAEKLLEIIKANFKESTFTRKNLEELTNWNYQTVRRPIEELLDAVR